MKKLLAAITLFLSISSPAAEIVSIVSPYSASHSGTPAMQLIVNHANQAQSKYKFMIEFKPGAEQLLALKELDSHPTTHLAIIAPKYVEHSIQKTIDPADYVPIHALGDACWAVISNLGNESVGLASLQGQENIFVGGVGFGNATHLTSLQIAEKFKFKVHYVPFKSNFDALVNMAGNNGINLVIDRVSSARQLQNKNPDIKILAMSCAVRHPDAAHVKTLEEQGITAPFVFNITVSHRAMSNSKRQELKDILDKSTKLVGLDEIQRLSDMRPPVFTNANIDTYFQKNVDLVRQLLKKHQASIQP